MVSGMMLIMLIMNRQGDRSCTTRVLTTGPWAGETYEVEGCMDLNMDQCINFMVLNDSYYDPSHVKRISFHQKGKEKSLIYSGNDGLFHSANTRENRACV